MMIHLLFLVMPGLALRLPIDQVEIGKELETGMKIQSDGLNLQKIKSGDGARVLFIAGLEGAGHHLIEAITKKTGIAAMHIPHGCHIKRTTQEFKNIFSKLKPGLHLLPQQYSFPCAGDFPNLPGMIEAANQTGVSMHVIFLHRKASDCLKANCITRKFGTCDAKSSDLREFVGYMEDSAKLLDNDQKSCFKFGDMQSMKEALEPFFGKKIHDIIEQTFHVGGNHASAEIPEFANEGISTKLLETDAKMNSICGY